MHIGINARFLSARISGVERYARNVTEELIRLAPQRGHRITVFGPLPNAIETPLSAAGTYETVATLIPPTAVGRHLWEQLILPAIAKRKGVDALLNLANTAPARFEGTVLCLHDVSWKIGPSWFSSSFRWLYSVLIPAAARNARMLVAGADGPADDIASAMGVPRSKIRVIPYGVSDNFSVRPIAEVEEILTLRGISQPYLIHVGTIQPRKNIERLLLAYRMLQDQLGEQAPRLVLAGGTGAQFADMKLNDLLSTPGVLWIGYCDDAELPALYTGSVAAVSASLYEGYGLTLLEAMKCGTALVVSDIAPHRASAGNNAVFVDPLDVESIASGMREIVVNTALRSKLVTEGFNVSKPFTWQAHVNQMLDFIEQAFH